MKPKAEEPCPPSGFVVVAACYYCCMNYAYIYWSLSCYCYCSLRCAIGWNAVDVEPVGPAVAGWNPRPTWAGVALVALAPGLIYTA